MDNNNIFNLISDFRDEYKRLLLVCLKECLSIISDAIDNKKHISNHYYNFPCLSYRDNGLPNLAMSSYNAPDYASCCFKKEIYDTIKSFIALREFVKTHKELQKRFSFSPDGSYDDSSFDDKLFASSITSGISGSIERYIHTFKSFIYNEEQAIDAVAPSISYIFDKELFVDIYLPILFVNFQFDEFKIENNVYIKRMRDEEHLTRYKIESHNTNIHKEIISSATHALVLKNWWAYNHECIWNFCVLSELGAYSNPLELVDKFFGALRIVSPVNTGYAQIFSLAINWERNYIENLPYVEGTTTRAYPSWFENYYLNINTIPVISRELMEDISTIYKQINRATENSINLSLKRLNRCLVRDNEEDSVLDAVIALEILLSDDSGHKIAHKLASRISALSKLDKNFHKNPQQVFKDIKSIYSYRSEIVHGSKNVERKRIIQIDKDNKTPAYELAIEYVRMVLKVLLQNPSYRKPKEIDKALLLGDSEKNI